MSQNSDTMESAMESFEPPLAIKIPVSNNPNRKKKPSLVVARKLLKLDKIFLEKITDLLSTSDYGMEILENRIEITQAQVQIGYSAIHVFWASSNITHDETTNNLFIKIAPLLRHELKQLNIFGCVPPLLFIKDVSSDKMDEIDRKLAIADFGEDYEPTISKHIISSPVLHKRLKDDVWKTVNQMSKEVVNKECAIDEFDHNIPKLEQNIYGLQRGRIMNSVIKGMKSSKAMHRKPREQSDMEHQRSFISPAIIKSTSFSQVEGVRTADIRNWANQFRKIKTKMQKINVTDEEFNQDFDDHYEELNDDGRDYIDYDNYEDRNSLNDYEENSLNR